MFILGLILNVFCSEFDYIVVGSGPGGGTVATELAIKGFKTLLIEAGSDHWKPNQFTPGLHATAALDPETSFGFDVKHSLNNVSYFYPRAGALGGCIVHNAMLSIYPNTRDFELMHNTTGDEEWLEKNMRNYFKRMEGNQYIENRKDHLHGFDGWFKTSYLVPPEERSFQFTTLVAATIGDPQFDINGKDSIGLNSDKEAKSFIPQAVDKSTFTRTNFPAYMRSVAKTHPLTIWTDTFVTRVLFNATTAVGVEYKKGKYLYKASPLSTNHNNATLGSVMANKETIISGGTFNTPQILMLSGIGDKEHLEEFNISVVSHVPGVGRNMMDRYEIPVVLQYPSQFDSIKKCQLKASEDDPCYAEYMEHHTGPYTSNGAISGQLKKSNPKLKEADLFILDSLSDFHGYFRGYNQNLVKRCDSSTRLILKAHTNNTNGHVKLLSSNPFDVPDIHFHYFSDGDSDLDILVESLKAERENLSKLNITHTELYPGKAIQTDDQLRDYIKETAWGHHACCTAKMGTSHDPDAVVDAKFRVRGVKNLRVVDMSIFPKIPGYFPTLYIHMMAMKAADDITS
ncbi:hypothetical protein DSO57_1004642 [Entomophthora muscae]|uniref:Uncharacterized protein n=1 Tax=Entomophthora muscae TaxID=34485 RepID=A0ACC2SL58_9FUNG|nr:hypothetical protein DSO57_1004642 [Entomophthora muscae]